MDLAHLFHRSAARWPDNPLWVSTDRPSVSYADGVARVDRLADAVLARTPQRSRVAILSTNRFEGMEAYLGTITAGCAAVTLNPRGHVEDYRYAITDSEASIVLCDAELVDRLLPLRDELPAVKYWAVFGGGSKTPRPPGFEDYESWLGQATPARPDISIQPGDTAWHFYTSGTTGRPKGALETHANLLAMTRHFMLELGEDLAVDDVMLHLAPISHGSTSVAWPHLAVGAANAFPAALSFDPAAVFSTVERLGVTTTMLAPTMIRMLLDSEAIEDHDLSSLKTVVYGGASMPVADLRRALERFGPIFLQFYGQAEAAATMTCLPKADHSLDAGETALRRLASAGRETFGTRLRIVRPDGVELPPGEVGEITVRGELVMPGYWKRPEATAETIRDGWLHTGDAGYLDEGGYLFITDRIKDMIISGGSNVYAREVEDVLGRLDGVDQIAVIGLPDEKWGEVVAAVVVQRPGAGLAAEDVVRFAEAEMAGYKKPRRVFFLEELPTSAYGKVLKRELRKQLSAEAVVAP